MVDPLVASDEVAIEEEVVGEVAETHRRCVGEKVRPARCDRLRRDHAGNWIEVGADSE